MRLPVLLLAVLCGASSCGGGLERVAFVSDLLVYRPGGRVGLTMTNVSSTPVSVNLCLSRLVREDRVSGPASIETCDLAQAQIAVGHEHEARKTIPEGTTAGKWRYETTITLENGTGEVVSTPIFTVSN